MFSLAMFTACENDDTDFSDIINGGKDPEYVPKSIEFDYTSLKEPDESFDFDDDDYVENMTVFYTVEVKYDGNTATVDGDGGTIKVLVDGAHVTVNSTARNVEYILSGSSSNGSFKVYSESKLKIGLDNLTLTNPDGPAINNQCGKSMYVELTPGSVNKLADGTRYVEEPGEDMKGTIFSEGQIIFNGAGRLDIEANCKNGIASDDYIVFRPGNVINVKSNVSNGVKANDGVDIRGGVLNIDIAADAGKGINSEFDVTISGGRTTVITAGGPFIEYNDTSSCAGIKCDSTFTMTAGTVNLKSTGEGGKGINCDENISVTGGELNIVTTGKKDKASPKGIKADGTIAFSGGKIYSYSKSADAIDAAEGFTFTEGYTFLNNKKNLFEITY